MANFIKSILCEKKNHFFRWVKIVLKLRKLIDRKHKYAIYHSEDIVSKYDLFHQVKLPQKREIQNQQYNLISFESV